MTSSVPLFCCTVLNRVFVWFHFKCISLLNRNQHCYQQEIGNLCASVYSLYICRCIYSVTCTIPIHSLGLFCPGTSTSFIVVCLLRHLGNTIISLTSHALAWCDGVHFISISCSHSPHGFSLTWLLFLWCAFHFPCVGSCITICA